MPLSFRFGIVSDPHIGLPHTIWDHPSRFHLVEASIPGFEQAIDHFIQMDIDFLLLPGDLVQHGERDNHVWLAERLSQLPFPTFVVPGNHDVIQPEADEQVIDWAEFTTFYQKFGYRYNPGKVYYSCSPVPGLRLIGLNSNQFDKQGYIIGRLCQEQLDWLQQELAAAQSQGEVIWVMLHHNVIEHLPQQGDHLLGRRYILSNRQDLIALLQVYGVRLMFTGHLHVQDVSQQGDLYEITTGSLVSYPHPYRLGQFVQDETGQGQLTIESPRIQSVPNFPDLPGHSREWMGDRSVPFMMKLLTCPPLNWPEALALKYAPDMRYFWADIADGDRLFDFADFPEEARRYFKSFGAIDAAGNPQLIDNAITLVL